MSAPTSKPLWKEYTPRKEKVGIKTLSQKKLDEISKLPVQVPRICTICLKDFMIARSQFAFYKNAGLFCSRKCSSEGKIKNTLKNPPKRAQQQMRGDAEWSKAVKERDNHRCRKCGSNYNLHSHHIGSRTQRPDLRQELSNGVTLCAPCHMWAHHHPIEAKEQGYISDARYELATRKAVSEGNKKTLEEKVGRMVACTMCGREKYYSRSNLKNISEAHRCMECYKKYRYVKDENSKMVKPNEL